MVGNMISYKHIEEESARISFKENGFRQISISDSFTGLTEREQKALEKLWAKVFADEMFPAIDEKRFVVLCSDKVSRTNTPINIVIGALISDKTLSRFCKRCYVYERLHNEDLCHDCVKDLRALSGLETFLFPVLTPISFPYSIQFRSCYVQDAQGKRTSGNRGL